MGLDEEDFVFFGTPIEREEELASRKKKAVAEASGQLRTLPHWKQEVRDEEGRRRFHGAFTGGFSAGYYNTVGSKEGWAPQSFTSSRKNRAEVKEQNILNFLDEDEKTDLEGRSLGTSFQFDTFGFTASEFARKQAEKEQQQRPSAIPGPVPDEIVIPATESIGVKLLLKMGWRRGRSIKDSRANSLYEERREARKAFLAFSSGDVKSKIEDDNNNTDVVQPANEDYHLSQSTPDYVLEPKLDLYGLGFDPYKHAPEFREIKKARKAESRLSSHEKAFPIKHSLFGFKSSNVASGFGIGALEDLGTEDEDVYASEYQFEETYVQELDDSSRLITDGKEKIIGKEQGLLPRFRNALKSDYQLERFDPPVIPEDFVPRHKFSGPLETDYKFAGTPPAEVPPPDDKNLKLLIDGVSTLVARCGKVYEDLSKEKNKSNPMFSFLVGGNGHDYYARKLWEEQSKRLDHNKHMPDAKLSPNIEKMTADRRGKILGEKPLERSSNNSKSSLLSADVQLQYHLSDTFTKSGSFNKFSEVVKPFKDDPAKQERFEHFLKEKYYGGLRSTGSGGVSNMSEAARARERLDFEAAAESIEKAKGGTEVKLLGDKMSFSATGGGMQFTSGGVEKVADTKAEDLAAKEIFPKREEFQWRPAPILCKRFDLIDPFMGKPPPVPRMRSKIDSLIFMKDSVESSKVEETLTASMHPSSSSKTDTQVINKDAIGKDVEEEVQIANIERPVDLYKAIFSDDSDDEGGTSNLTRVENPDKKTEVANTALNRLIAGDFLESLGKELGLEVPLDLPPSINKVGIRAHQKEIDHGNSGNAGSSSVDDLPSSIPLVFNGSMDGVLPGNNELLPENSEGRGSKHMDKVSEKKLPQNETKVNRNSNRSRDSGESSSEDEKRRKRSRRRRHRSSDSEDDSSSGNRHDYHSGSNKRSKGHSREKISSRKSSKHHKHKRRDSSPSDQYVKHSTDSKRDRRK